MQDQTDQIIFSEDEEEFEKDENDVFINDRYVYNKEQDLIQEEKNTLLFIGGDLQSDSQVYIKIIFPPFFDQKKPEKKLAFEDIDPSSGNSIENLDQQLQKTQEQLKIMSYLTNQKENYEKIQHKNSKYIHKIKEIILQADQNKLILIYEYHECTNMSKYLYNTGYVDEITALNIFYQICQGVQIYHSNNTTHGYINFDNILISDSNFILSDIYNNEMVQFKSIQSIKKRNQDYQKTYKDDIWALGIVLYRLLEGTSPFKGNFKKMIEQIENNMKEKLNSEDYIFPILVSEKTENFIEQMLNIEEKERPSIQNILDMELFSSNPYIRLEVSEKIKKDFSPPAIISDKYSIHMNSRQKINYDNYFHIEQYLAFEKEKDNFVTIKKINFQQNFEIYQKQEQNLIKFLKIVKDSHLFNVNKVIEFHYDSDKNQLYWVTEYSNQGNLEEYLQKKKSLELPIQLDEVQTDSALFEIYQNLKKINNKENNFYHGGFHPLNLFIKSGKLLMGEPLFINEEGVERIQENQNKLDIFAPEFKQNIKNNEKFFSEKVDIWSFGMVFCKLVYGDVPVFNEEQVPIFPQTIFISEANQNLIDKCLKIDPHIRGVWEDLEKENMPFKFKKKPEENQKSQSKYIRNKLQYNLETEKKEKQADGDNNNILEISMADLQEEEKQEKEQEYEQKEPINVSILKPKQEEQFCLVNKDKYLYLRPEDYNQSESQKLEEVYRLLREPEQKDIFHEKIVPISLAGSKSAQKIKISTKIILTILSYYFLFFYSFVNNAIYMIFERGKMELYTLQLRNENMDLDGELNVITKDLPNLLLKDQSEIEFILKEENCFGKYFSGLQNEQTLQNPDILEKIQSSLYFWWAFMGFLSFLLIIILKSIQIAKRDIITMYKYQQKAKKVDQYYKIYYSRLLYSLICINLEFTFLYYAHYQLFSIFYYIKNDQCLGITEYDGTNMIFGTTKYFLSSNTSEYITQIFNTLIIFFAVHVFFIIFFLLHNLENSSILLKINHGGLRLLSYVIGCILICRIGYVFTIEPTLRHDSGGIIDSVFKNFKFAGILGFFPEILEIILCFIDLFIEAINYKIHYEIEKKKENQGKNQNNNQDKQAQNNVKLNKVSAIQSMNRRKRIRNSSKLADTSATIFNIENQENSYNQMFRSNVKLNTNSNWTEIE